MTARASSIVIAFPAERVRPAAPCEPGTSAGEVLIFTGVRIERLPDDGEAVPKARSGLGRKRRGQRR
jgi:hypothetical protein